MRSKTGGIVSCASSGSINRNVPSGSNGCAKAVYSRGNVISPQNDASPYPKRP
jgi:hypothetical protein